MGRTTLDQVELAQYITTMDNHRYAHKVATFMQQYFQFRLSQATGHSTPTFRPAVPEEIDAPLYQACLFAVERCLCAFTNPGMVLYFREGICRLLFFVVYVDWDYEAYCEDCRSRHLSNGGNSAKEKAFREAWEPKYRNTMRIRRAATIVDLKSRIIGWILPEVLLPCYQVPKTFYLDLAIALSSYLHIATEPITYGNKGNRERPWRTLGQG